jgi:hypothetical protein
VTVTAWRIVKRKHARAAFTGEGARLFGGRWNSPGMALVYTAQSQSLAALEMLVHLESPELLANYILFEVGIDESLLARVELSQLPNNWRSILHLPRSRPSEMLGLWAVPRQSYVSPVHSYQARITSSSIHNMKISPSSKSASHYHSGLILVLLDALKCSSAEVPFSCLWQIAGLPHNF